MCIAIVFSPGFDVINFETNLSFLNKPLNQMEKKCQNKNLIICMKSGFKIQQESHWFQVSATKLLGDKSDYIKMPN